MKAKAAYIVGAVLVFSVSVVCGCLMISTIPAVRLTLGLIFGGVMGIAAVAGQLFVQFALNKLVAVPLRLSAWKKSALLSVPVVAAILWLVAGTYSGTNPTAHFKRLLKTPIPQSVRSIKRGGSFGVDGGFWAFRFEIAQTDLQKLVTDLQFTTEQDDRGSAYWQKRLLSRAGVAFDLQEPYQSYILKGNRAERRLFYSTNSSVAYFIHCTYSGGA